MAIRSKYQQLCDYLTMTIILVIVVGIPCSNILMSIGGIALAAMFLISPKLLSRTKQVFKEPFTMFALALFIWHVVGLLWTYHIDEGIRDIRIKLPILLFPIALAGIFKLTAHQRLWVIRIYLLTVFTNTLVLFGIHERWYGPDIQNFRDISLFISHIRLSLNICFAIGLLWLYPGVFNTTNKVFVLLKIAFSIWAIYFLSILESGTSMLIGASTIVIGFLYFIFNKTTGKQKIITLCLFFVGTIIGTTIISTFYRSVFTPKYSSTLNHIKYNNNQKNYTHYHHSLQVENGFYVNHHINLKELTRAWNKRTHSNLFEINNTGYQTKANLLRYLTSKGLTKDSIGLSKISDEEIKHIINGATNYRFTNANGFVKRLYAIMFEWSEYKLGHSPNGHSLFMRLEFVKTGIHILKNNWVKGVGTGDLQAAFNKAYKQLNSKLAPKWRHRAHNQYLSVWLALGVVGLLLFFGMILYPFYSKNKFPVYTWYFVLIMLLSFITEDTLETQAGVTFIMFFASFLFVPGVSRPITN